MDCKGTRILTWPIIPDILLIPGPQNPLYAESDDYANTARSDPTTCINECLHMCFLILEFDNRNELVIF